MGQLDAHTDLLNLFPFRMKFRFPLVSEIKIALENKLVFALRFSWVFVKTG